MWCSCSTESMHGRMGLVPSAAAMPSMQFGSVAHVAGGWRFRCRGPSHDRCDLMQLQVATSYRNALPARRHLEALLSTKITFFLLQYLATAPNISQQLTYLQCMIEPTCNGLLVTASRHTQCRHLRRRTRSHITARAARSALVLIPMRTGQRFPTLQSAGEYKTVSRNATTVSISLGPAMNIDTD